MIRIILKELYLQCSFRTIQEFIKRDNAHIVLYVICCLPKEGMESISLNLATGMMFLLVLVLSRISQNRGVKAFYLVPITTEERIKLFRQRYLVRSMIPIVGYSLFGMGILLISPKSWMEILYNLGLLLLYSLAENLYVGSCETLGSKKQDRKGWEKTIHGMECWDFGIRLVLLIGFQPFFWEGSRVNSGQGALHMADYWNYGSDSQQFWMLMRVVLYVGIMLFYIGRYYSRVREIAVNYERIQELERSTEWISS